MKRQAERQAHADEIFDLIDVNNDGVIDRHEFGAYAGAAVPRCCKLLLCCAAALYVSNSIYSSEDCLV